MFLKHYIYTLEAGYLYNVQVMIHCNIITLDIKSLRNNYFRKGWINQEVIGFPLKWHYKD